MQERREKRRGGEEGEGREEEGEQEGRKKRERGRGGGREREGEGAGEGRERSGRRARAEEEGEKVRSERREVQRSERGQEKAKASKHGSGTTEQFSTQHTFLRSTLTYITTPHKYHITVQLLHPTHIPLPHTYQTATKLGILECHGTLQQKLTCPFLLTAMMPQEALWAAVIKMASPLTRFM